jgi:hypothetical protein
MDTLDSDTVHCTLGHCDVSSLTALHLSCRRLRDACRSFIADAVRKHPFNITRDTRRCIVDFDDLTCERVRLLAMCAARGALRCIVALRMVGNGLGDDGCAVLSRCLASMPSLTSLNVSHNNIFTGIVTLGERLGELGNLRRLVLDGNRIDQKGMRSLSPHFLRLSFLSMACSHVDSEGVALIVGTFPLERLEALYLCGNTITKMAMDRLVFHIHMCPLLHLLDVRYNLIKDDDMDRYDTCLRFASIHFPLMDSYVAGCGYEDTHLDERRVVCFGSPYQLPLMRYHQ